MTGGFRKWVVPGVAVAAALAVGTTVRAQRDAHGEERREKWQKVDEIFTALQIRPGVVVADIGAGDGFFTARLAAAVGDDGRVLAVDVGASALRRLKTRVANESLSNVEVIEGAADDPKLPPAAVDAALIVNAYHEMAAHQAMLSKIRAALKPDGRLVIVEPISRARRTSGRDEQIRSHEIAPELVRDEVRAAGFRELALHDPFTERPNDGDEEWMLVATPEPAAVGDSRAQTSSAAQVFSSRNEDWKAPELRIGVEEFKRLEASGGVLVLDVRDPVSYREGHLPGAVLMTPQELSTPEGAAKLKGEKRLIITYCS
jgi:predicted methyltransferase